jgi:hypothetical protein
VQAHNQNHDLHQEDGGTREAWPVSASCEVISSPMDQRAYPGTLEAKRKRYQKSGCTRFAKKAHRPLITTNSLSLEGDWHVGDCQKLQEQRECEHVVLDSCRN